MKNIKERIWSIHELADEFHITTHTLRYYERIGIIGPVKRDPSGRRQYSEDQYNWLKYLICFRNTGMSLDEIKQYISLIQEGETTTTDRKQFMVKHREKILQNLEETKKHLEMIDFKIEYYTEIENKMRELSIRKN